MVLLFMCKPKLLGEEELSKSRLLGEGTWPMMKTVVVYMTEFIMNISRLMMNLSWQRRLDQLYAQGGGGDFDGQTRQV